MDPCLELTHAARERPSWSPAQKLMAEPLLRLFMHGHTPQERIERAVRRELVDLCERADRALSLLLDSKTEPAIARARELLGRARREGCFPRSKLEALLREGGSESGSAPPLRVKRELEIWIDKHRRLERRLRWLLDPTLTRAELSTLDPLEDSDRIWCWIQYEFRPEFLHSAWGNANKRIAQVESATTFIHATGKAEATPVRRAEETLCYYYYFFEWGEDSYHGRKAIEGMNRIHGRYFVHNDAMKYVLLSGPFTVLDGLSRVAHRPLTETERLGCFHASIKMGQAMHIQGLSHCWDEMHDWFYGLCRAWAGYSPRKARMWNAIHDSFDRTLGIPRWLGRLRRLPEVYAMDELYRSALGLREPLALELTAFRQLIKLLARARRSLPVGPWILSLQDFYSFPNGVDVEKLGEPERSPRLPSACPFSGQKPPNKGYPVGQRPLLEIEDALETELGTLTWEEVRKHNTEDDLWVVFGGYVYDVSSFAKNHPGGLEVLLNGAGRDLTRAFEAAGHSDITQVFTLNFRVGRIESAETSARPRLRAPAEIGAAE